MKRSALALWLCFWLGGCAGVTRVPERTRGQQGPTEKIDLSFLDAAQVTRAQVLEKLKPVDTGFQSDHFFVGRWETSKWGGWALDTSVGVEAERFWHNANLVVEFDDTGMVKSHAVFPDKLLPEKLQPVAREAKLSAEERLDMSLLSGTVPVPVSVGLLPDSLEFTQTSKAKKPLQIRVPAGSLIGIHSSLLCATDPWPAYVMETLQFDRSLKSFGGPREKRVCAKMTVPQLLTLLRYISEHRGKTTQAVSAPSPGRETAEQPQGLRASSGAKARDVSPRR
jgi:hypothetical protein